jgi:heat shock protein HslJ
MHLYGKTTSNMKTLVILKKITILVIVILLINSCSKDDSDISYDLTGSWKVIYFIDNGKKVTKTDDNTWLDINNGDITANFTEHDSSGKGTISGITVSNAYNGEYTIQGNGEISFSPITSTFINEPEWTELYNIYSSENFEIRDSRLLICYNNKKNIIAFERN